MLAQVSPSGRSLCRSFRQWHSQPRVTKPVKPQRVRKKAQTLRLRRRNLQSFLGKCCATLALGRLPCALWIMIYQCRYRRVYFFNRNDGRSQWERPTELPALEEEVPEHRDREYIDPSNSPGRRSSSSEAWEALVDADSGKQTRWSFIIHLASMTQTARTQARRITSTKTLESLGGQIHTHRLLSRRMLLRNLRQQSLRMSQK